jgi:sugar (pentulose or hexulose) kinase
VTALTLDLGTSSTKAALWSGNEITALVRVPVATSHPESGRAEQDPEDWWRSVIDACSRLRTAAPDAYAAVDSLGCSAARETFACFDENLTPLSPGILWSDTRGSDQFVPFGDPAAFRHRTGVLLSGGCQAATVAWVRQHHPAWFEHAAWILSPRDYVLARLTGSVRTEMTLASRTGFYALNGDFIGDRELAARLPPVIPSLELTPVLHGRDLALPTDVAAILGAGDRACEVIGVGAAVGAPMVSWGTTVNVSVPLPGPPELVSVAQISRAPDGSYLLEAGLSTGGSAFDWLASLTGWSSTELLDAAAQVAPGSNGVVAFPWLHGARAPWWHPSGRGAFVGITGSHGPPDLARAFLEGIALDAARAVELLAPEAATLFLAGAGARNALWQSLLAAVSECRVTIRASAEAATVGARALLAIAHGDTPALEALNPVRSIVAPQPALVETYRDVRAASDQVARALLGDA